MRNKFLSTPEPPRVVCSAPSHYTPATVIPDTEITVVKFADNVAIIARTTKQEVGFISGGNQHEWCTENNLLLNVNKPKELIGDFRKKVPKTHARLHQWS